MFHAHPGPRVMMWWKFCCSQRTRSWAWTSPQGCPRFCFCSKLHIFFWQSNGHCFGLEGFEFHWFLKKMASLLPLANGKSGLLGDVKRSCFEVPLVYRLNRHLKPVSFPVFMNGAIWSTCSRISQWGHTSRSCRFDQWHAQCGWG